MRSKNFGIDRAKPDGLNRICRKCISENGGHVYKGPSKTTATHKWCPRCSRSKPFSSYHKHRGQPLGLAQFCKVCTVAHTREWRAKQRAVPRKKCAAMCRRLLPLDKFPRSAISEDGRYPSCQRCTDATLNSMNRAHKGHEIAATLRGPRA